MPGSCARSRASIADFAPPGCAAAASAAKASAAAASRAASGKRIEVVDHTVDLRRLEDAMLAVGRHEGVRIRRHGVDEERAQPGAAEAAHARAVEPGPQVRA